MVGPVGSAGVALSRAVEGREVMAPVGAATLTVVLTPVAG